MTPLSERPAEEARANPAAASAARIRERIEAEKQAEAEREDAFERLQALAVQRAKYHPNESMGAKKGVDCATISNNEVEDDEWDD